MSLLPDRIILSKEESARLVELAARPADPSGERYRRSMRVFASRKGTTHYNLEYGVSFCDERQAQDFLNVELGLTDAVIGQGWYLRPCPCDNLTRAERLALTHPRLFGWLMRREDE